MDAPGLFFDCDVIDFVYLVYLHFVEGGVQEGATEGGDVTGERGPR